MATRHIKAVKAEWRDDKRTVVYGPPEDIERRRRLEPSLKEWLRWYFPAEFCKPWSESHEQVIHHFQVALEQGGKQAVAMPRGEGKTTLTKGAALWAIMTGRVRYVLLVGATSAKAAAMLRDIKQWLRFSPRLGADYPEVCSFCAAGGGNAALAKHLCREDGEKCEIQWQANRVVLATAPTKGPDGEEIDSPASGAVLDCDGITGDIRGHVHALPEGGLIRPGLAIVDDPQTRESAKSPEQCKFRLNVIKGDVAGSAGPGETITTLVPCTVIQRGDLADQLLDKELNPDFRGIRTSMIRAWPEDMEIWEHEYNVARVAGIDAEDNGKSANDFYLKHRARMDKGAVVGWDQRVIDTEISAIQHAMNLYLKLGKVAFASEYQNQPEDDISGDFVLTVKAVHDNVNHMARRTLPIDAAILTAFTDINDYGLSWCASGFGQAGMTCSVADYGITPEVVPLNASETEANEATYEALVQLGEHLSNLVFTRDGKEFPLRMWLIDAGYRGRTVQSFVRSARLPFRVMASRGYAATKYRPVGRTVIGQPKEQCHLVDGRLGHYIAHDADYWREVAQRAFLASVGAPGGASLFGKQPLEHIEFAEHVCREVLVGKAKMPDGGWVYKWKQKPGKNDLLDAYVGTWVAAAVEGYTTGKRNIGPRRRAPVRRRVAA